MARLQSPAIHRRHAFTRSVFSGLAWRAATSLLGAVLVSWLAYLFVANALLMSGLLGRWISNDELLVRWSGAWSVLPGRAHLTDFSLRHHDSGVELWMQIDRASVDVQLSALPGKVFHVARLDADGLRLHARSRIQKVGNYPERIRALAPIPGRPDPPLAEPEKPEPPGKKYDKWTIVLENVTVESRELWLQEYRLTGRQRAKGGFFLQPNRRFEVYDSELSASGTLSVGNEPLLDWSSSRLRVRVKGHDTREVEGAEFLRLVTATAVGRARVHGLSALNVYLEPYRPMALASGAGNLDVQARLVDGVLSDETRAEYRTAAFRFELPRFSVSGPLSARIEPNGKRGAERHTRAWLEAPVLALESAEPKPWREPSIKNLRAEVTLSEADLSKAVAPSDMELKFAPSVPDLRWLTTLQKDGISSVLRGGSADGVIDLRRFGDGRTNGSFELRLRRARLELMSAEFQITGSYESKLAVLPSAKESGALRDVRLELDEIRIRPEGEDPTEWWVTARSSALDIGGMPPKHLRGTLHIEGMKATPLLPLLVPSGLLRRLITPLLALDSTKGRIEIDLDRKQSSLRIRRLSSGRLDLQGFLLSKADSSRGAFVLDTPLNRFGIELRNGQSETHSSVSDDWLSQRYRIETAKRSVR
jgi:hypothetical protein